MFIMALENNHIETVAQFRPFSVTPNKIQNAPFVWSEEETQEQIRRWMQYAFNRSLPHTVPMDKAVMDFKIHQRKQRKEKAIKAHLARTPYSKLRLLIRDGATFDEQFTELRKTLK